MSSTVVISTIVILASILTPIHSSSQDAEVDGQCPFNLDSSCQSPADHNNLIGQPRESDDECFKAAVFEYARRDLPNVGDSIKFNLREYRQAAKLAADHGVQMIVFPEDGLVYGKAQFLLEHLHAVPDPDHTSINPCLDSGDANSNPILKELSCIARDHNIWLVANFGTRQDCEPNESVGDRKCPNVGYLKLNTDVVLDSTGRFIKRYRKYHTYTEPFDRAPSLETAYFDTPFGRFGIFTCFDMIFKNPAIDLVEKFQVDTILFPTYWYDELPLLSAIQYQDGWSLRNEVNLLASNILRPAIGSVGSGIYSGDGFIYTGANITKSSLLIASVSKHPKKQANCLRKHDRYILETETGDESIYKHSSYKLLDNDAIRPLKANEDKMTICKNQICCTIDYELQRIDDSDRFDDRLVVILRDSRRDGRFRWHEQVCIMATLEKPFNDAKLINTRFSANPLANFKRLSMSGVFSTKYVYPIAAHNVSRLVERSQRKYACRQEGQSSICKLELIESTDGDKEVYSFGLYGRDYDSDDTRDLNE